MAERIDEIGFGGLKLIQNPEEFCYGVDAVILADFAASTSKKKDAIIDLGTGTGIIPLILSHKTNASRIVGVEVQKNSYDMAVRNAQINGLEDRVSFIHANVTEVTSKERFDVVTCNPPYARGGSSMVSRMDAKAIARHEIAGTLDDFLKAAAMLLKDKGELFMVHRPSRLVDIFCNARKYRLEPKTMQMVAPAAGEAPNIVLIHFIKGAGVELRNLPELFIYEKTREYSKKIQKIYER